MRFPNGVLRAIFTLNFWLLPALALAAGVPELVVSNEAGATVFSAPIQPDKGFAIRYKHSVALTPVIDYFRIKSGDIYIDATVYEDFGAGLPHDSDKDEKMSVEHGKIILSGLNRKVSPFELRVGRVANHTLILDDGEREIPLSSLAKPGSALRFSAKSPE